MPVVKARWTAQEESLPAHERQFLRLVSLSHSAEGRQCYEDIQKQGERLSGFVIASWEDQGDDPKSYAYDLVEDGLWRNFWEDTVEEDPSMCAKLYTLLSHVTRLRVENPNMRIGVAFWRHPQAHDKPLEKYEQMTDSRFPGSPRH